VVCVRGLDGVPEQDRILFQYIAIGRTHEYLV
jgi:hypothetical protein